MTCDDDQREFYDVYGELEGPMACWPSPYSVLLT